MNPQILPQTKEEFYKLYWFTPLQLVTLVNPKEYDYPFMVEMRHFIIGAGKTEIVPGNIANIYLSQMTRIMAQDDDRMEFLSDYALMKRYFDQLIVDVKSLVNDVDTTPAYMKDVPEHMKVSGESETPPWQQPTSTLPEHNSTMSDRWTPPEPKTEPKAPVKDETKEFDLNSIKYKAVIKKTGGSMYYKDGKLTSSAEYQKAASLL